MTTTYRLHPMTTSSSDPIKLAEQAKKIVTILKEYKWPDFKESVVVGVMMDDKVIKLTVTKETITETSPEVLEAWFLSYMSGETVQ
jgi:hypothetical protein